MPEEFDPSPRDGPTEERARHGSGIASRDSGLGKRTVSPIERLLHNKDVTPEQADAGRRFAVDYEISAERQRSALAMLIGGGRLSASDISPESRSEAIARWYAAAKALDHGRSPYAVGMAPSAILRRFLMDLERGSLTQLSRTLGYVQGERGVKALIIGYLATLALHYEDVDKERGRSETPQTKEAALKKIIASDDQR